MDLNIKIYIV